MAHTPTTRFSAILVLALAGCNAVEPGAKPDRCAGGQSGCLKEELPMPEDVDKIDYGRAASEAVRLALAADLVAPWRGHVDLLSRSDGECPTLFIGQPEDAMVGDEDNLSWAGSCSYDDTLEFNGFMTWDMAIDEDGTGASREAGGDALIFEDGELALEFDGEATDSVTWLPGGGWSYASTMEGQFSGPVAYGADSPVPGGFRGSSDVAYDSSGTLHVDANLYFFGDPLLDRFDAIAVDIDFEDGCTDEPLGYIGLRGTDGFWFDIYFLPRYAADDPTAAASAYPYELIEDPTCDGCGSLFVRNVRAELPNDVCPDFASVAAGLGAPTIDEYVMTLHDLPWDEE